MRWGKADELILVVRDGPAMGQRIRIGAEILIGRGEGSTVTLPDLKMSRCHARVRLARDRLLVEDLQSNNGTWLNGRRVRKAKLRAGDRLQLGRTELEVVPWDDPSAEDEEPVEVSATRYQVLTLTDFTPAKVEAMPTREFMSALGMVHASGELLSTLDDEALSNLRDETRNFAITYNVARALQEAPELTALLRTAASFLFKVTDAERCYVLLANPKTGALEVGLARHRDPTVGPIPLELSRAIVEQVMAEQRALITYDAADDPRFAGHESVHALGMRAVLCAPILHGKELLGVLQLDALTSGSGFERPDFELVTVIASLLGHRIQNVRLFEEQAETIHALRAAQDELVRKERMAVLGRLTSGLAHEIGNLMMPFGLVAQLAAARPEDTELGGTAELIDEALNRIDRLLLEVRLLARGEEPPGVASEAQDLHETVRAVVRFARCDERIRRHLITVEGGEGLPELVFDRGAVKQVLLNLLRNAAQALERAGRIRIGLTLEGEPAAVARIEVEDDGPGIPPATRERIFEPFFSTKSSGTGLGLDISRRIIERLGGTIECWSELGQGTRMTVRLPLQPPGESP